MVDARGGANSHTHERHSTTLPHGVMSVDVIPFQILDSIHYIGQKDSSENVSRIRLRNFDRGTKTELEQRMPSMSQMIGCVW